MNKMVESMAQVDFSEMKIPMAVIYNSPKDCPGMYLCRIWEGAINRPTNTAMQKSSLDDMREDLQAAGFLIRFPRAEGDDPVILETWMR